MREFEGQYAINDRDRVANYDVMIRSCKNDNSIGVMSTQFFPTAASVSGKAAFALFNSICKSEAISPVIPLLNLSAKFVVALDTRLSLSFPPSFDTDNINSMFVPCPGPSSISTSVTSNSGFNNHIASCVTAYSMILSRFRRAVRIP